MWPLRCRRGRCGRGRASRGTGARGHGTGAIGYGRSGRAHRRGRGRRAAYYSVAAMVAVPAAVRRPLHCCLHLWPCSWTWRLSGAIGCGRSSRAHRHVRGRCAARYLVVAMATVILLPLWWLCPPPYAVSKVSQVKRCDNAIVRPALSVEQGSKHTG